MGELEQIFGAALGKEERERTVPQGTDAIESPSPVPDAAAGEGDVPTTEPMTRLAQFIMCAFRTNADHRRESGIDDRLLYALNANKATFTEKQLDALVSVGIPLPIAEKLHTPITSVKTRGAKALLVDLVSQGGDPMFTIESSPMPDVPESVTRQTIEQMGMELTSLFSWFAQQGVTELSPEAMAKLQQVVSIATNERYDELKNHEESFARLRAKRMQKKVWDVMVEGGWENAFSECIDNICTYGTAVMRGPVMKAVERNVCKESKNGVRRYVREVKLIPTFEAISPWDCYPAPDAKETDDGSFCIKVKYAGHDLWRFCDAKAAKEKNGEGWNADTVRAILERHPNGGVKLSETWDHHDAERRELENKGFDNTSDCTFEGVLCYAHVRGDILAEMGIIRQRDGKAIKANNYYRVESIVLDGYVVYCRILDDRMEFPISKATFYELSGSWWGESIADKLRLVQMMQNNTAKALFLDLAGTGSMFWVRNAGALRDKGPTATQFAPFKTISFDEPMYAPGSSALPMGTIDIPSRARELALEWDMWNQQADTDSGIPRFAEGQSAGQSGALRTASGLAQFNEHMMRGAKMTMTFIDNGLIKTTARRTADWILIHDDDMDLKGDVFVHPVGLLGRILRVQRDQARLQLFNIVVGNQFMLQLIGPKGVMALFRPSIQDIDVNPDDVLPGEERVKFMESIEELKQLAMMEMQGQRMAQQQAQAQGAQPQGEGAPPVEAPPSAAPMGGVEERRSVA